MRKLALPIAAILVAPARALAAGGGPDLVASLVQMVGSLILVVGIILILYWVAGKFLKVPQGGGARYIRVVEIKHLAPKKSLVLVEVGGEYLLISNSGEGMSLIKQVSMVEEIEVVEESKAALLIPESFKKKLQSLSRVLPADAAARIAELRKSGGLA
jgi:flagellar protein FliO/FliZ